MGDSIGVPISIPFSAVRIDEHSKREAMMRWTGSRPILVLAVLTLNIGAASEHKARLAFRLVVDDARPGDANVDMLDDSNAAGKDQPRTVAVSRDVLLDERGVASVEAVNAPPPQGRRIRLEMTPQGSETLKKITGENVGGRMAIVLDGKVLIAPVINSQVSRSVEITFGAGRDGAAEAKQQREVVDRIRSAIAATTQPAEAAPATRP
jgi:preprotein translocase subunit SecD